MKHATLVLSLTIALLAGWTYAEDPAHIPDPRLKQRIEATLHVHNPTPTDMLGLTSLAGCSFDIVNLDGLEFAHNLTHLNLCYNHITDIGPISGLHELTSITLNNNQINNLSPLSGLIELKHMDVHDNKLTDINALSNLINIETLILRYNNISDISPLEMMPQLRHLDLHGNSSSDISPLRSLRNLEVLRLQHNAITDIGPLADLTNLHTLYLTRNQISDLTPLLGLTTLDLLDLKQNTQLDHDAYCTHLDTIQENNPGVDLRYEANTIAVPWMYASRGVYADRIDIQWAPICNGPSYPLYYRVLRCRSFSSTPTPISEWQIALRYEDYNVESGARYFYTVQVASSAQGIHAGDLHDKIPGQTIGLPSLTLTSSPGGFVETPGEGVFPAHLGDRIKIDAVSQDPTRFTFSHWSGSAVENRYISKTRDATTHVTVNGSCTLHAHFISSLSTLHVDDDAFHDPGPNQARISDPLENGTLEHPFDTIQEAIAVAEENTLIQVMTGHYWETIDLSGKPIAVTGILEEHPYAPLPIIDGNNSGPVVACGQGSLVGSLLKGFVMTGGQGEHAGAVYCENSDLTLENCLIVGNRATDPNGAVIYCSNGHLQLVHCTLNGNHYGTNGAVFVVDKSEVTITDSILWDTHPMTSTRLIQGTTPVITYSNIAGGWLGLGNIDQDPRFAYAGSWSDPTIDSDSQWIDGDYHLMSRAGRWDPMTASWLIDNQTSPCIGAGHSNRNMGVYGDTPQASQ